VSLLHALELGRGDVVAVAGAGGKSTLVARLAADAAAAGLRAAVADSARREAPADTPERLAALRAGSDLLLVECDGARGRLIKTPAEHEPVLPEGATVLIVVASLAALGRPLDAAAAHRADRIAAAAGRPPGSVVDAHLIGSALATGYPERRPPGGRLLAFLNAAENEAARAAAVAVAAAVVPPFDAAFLGRARDGAAERAPVVQGLVLAAGGSTRMGRPKMLLELEGRPLVRHAVDPLLAAGLRRVCVVLGAEADAVRAALPADERIAVAVNRDWPSGLASSLQAGLRQCASADAVLVALGDQPSLTPAVVARVLAASPGRALVAATHDGRLVHPMLFGRALFPELQALRGDAGARDVVRRHRHEAAVVLGDASRDVDTEDDYRAAREGRPPRGGEGLV
jgi:molybdenum cofactor cytidylyltransferase